MAAWGRDTPWRQGHVLPDDTMKAAGLAVATTGALAIVVSHDCDLAQDPSVEPMAEVIVGRRIKTADGNFTYAKNARRLQLTFSGGIEHLAADLDSCLNVVTNRTPAQVAADEDVSRLHLWVQE